MGSTLARTRDMSNACKVVIGKPWKDRIKIYPRETEFEDGIWAASGSGSGCN